MNEENNLNYNSKLLISLQLINVFIGVIIALICGVAYITIGSIYVRGIIIAAAVGLGAICFINLYKRLHKEEVIEDESNINRIDLVNEENEIIRTWDIGERVSFIIGKNGRDNDVFIDLSCSIYSKFIENNHAVVNYAAGKWYIEDLSEESGISIQKADDDTKYRIVKDAPCELKRGDILYISKVKLLLK
ncbi:FHA domain-containing protein [Clostridium sp.]|uniref:FHA domain-containing protein n=1 Tax=Clostridium sp. TaxID=1506 RepID=UPI0026248092|nr:FHA domain-containing protein [Clostridium sp.]